MSINKMQCFIFEKQEDVALENLCQYQRFFPNN